LTYVYIMTPAGAEGPCKIGISENPEGRLRSLQCGSPNRLELREVYWPDTRDEAFAIEREFHDNYADWRMHGEWFGVEFDSANYWLFENLIAVEAFS
jgi:hypothetical protein